MAAPCSVRAQERSPEGKSVVEQVPEIPIGVDQDSKLEIALEDALRLGVLNNTNLKIDELLPHQASEDVRRARAAFEPELFATVRGSKTESPDRIFQAAGFTQPAITQEAYSGRFGIRQLVPSGGVFDLAFAPSKFRQNNGSGSTREFGSDFTVTYTQPLLRGAWSDYTLRDVHTQEAARAGAAHRYERAVQNTMLTIVQAYWDLVFARENYVVVYQALQLALEQLDRTERKIEVGEVAPLDRVSDQAEVARRREELVTAENDIRDREDDLRRLVFDDGDGELWSRGLVPITGLGDFPEPADLDWRELAAVAQRLRPDLRALRADVTIAEIQADVAARDVLPRLDLTSSYTTDGAAGTFPDSFDQATGFDFPDWSVQLEVSVPVGNNAALAARDRARLEVERAKRILYSAEIDVTLEVRDAVRRLRTLT